MVVFYSSIVGQPRVGISYSKQYGYILEQIRTIQYEFDMVVSQNVICSICNIFHIGTHYTHRRLSTVKSKVRQKWLHTYYLRYTPTPTPTDTDTDTDTDRHRQTPTFKSFFYPESNRYYHPHTFLR